MSVEALPAPATADSGPTAHTESRWTLDRSYGRFHAVAFVAVLMLISLFFRTRGLHVHFWVDEGLSVGIAGHPLSKIPHLLREDGSPPLYYVILHGWMQLRGHSEVATHELSLIFALIAIPIAFWAGLAVFNRRVAVYAAVIAALVPYLTGYAQETRMYSLMSVFSILVAASFVLSFVQRRRGYLPLFVISLTGALVPQEDVLDEAVKLAEAVTANGPLAVKAIKTLVRAAATLPPAEVWALQGELQPGVFGSEDAREGAAAFVERRPPVWKGR